MAKKKSIETEAEATAQTKSKKMNITEAFSFLDKINSNYAAFNSKEVSINVIDTGSPAINNIIGINGYPRGRITQIYGPQGSGKSFLSMIAAKNVLEEDPENYVLWLDAEHSFNYDWAIKMGCWNPDPNLNRMLILPITDGIEVFEVIYGKIKKDKFASKKVAPGILDQIIAGELKCPLIVIDSIASIITPREKSSPVGGLTVSALAGFLTGELRRISAAVEEANVALILINQVRQTMDNPYGDPYHHPGGENLKHQVSLSLYCERILRADALILTEKDNKDTLIGQKAKIVVKKSRFGPAPRSTTTTFLFAEGAGYNRIGIVDVELELIDLACKAGIILKGGAWFTLPNGEKFHGEKGVQARLKESPELLKDLLDRLQEVKSHVKIIDNTTVLVKECPDGFDGDGVDAEEEEEDDNETKSYYEE